MKKNILGNQLKNLREQHGMSQQVLAEQLEISNAFINYLELGKRLPGPETIKKYAEYFKTDLAFLEDVLEKQKLLNKENTEEKETEDIPETVQELTDLLNKVDKPLLEDLVTSFKKQINEHLVKMTANYNLGDLRDKYRKVLSFENDSEEDICIEGFLKMPEDNQMFFNFIRQEDAITLSLLQNDRSKIEIFEKWIGPHVCSYICDIDVPQVTETQRGVSFTWFSPSATISQQYTHLLQQEEVDLDCVLFNSGQLAWYIQTQAELDAV